jgi:hypothetical protein
MKLSYQDLAQSEDYATVSVRHHAFEVLRNRYRWIPCPRSSVIAQLYVFRQLKLYAAMKS